jgi:hypothetical protein
MLNHEFRRLRTLCPLWQLRLAPRALAQNLLASKRRHFAPFPTFFWGTQTTKAKPRLAVELAEFDAGRPITHARLLDCGWISIVMCERER